MKGTQENLDASNPVSAMAHRGRGKRQVGHKAEKLGLIKADNDRYNEQRPSQAEVTLSTYVPVSVPVGSSILSVHLLVDGRGTIFSATSVAGLKLQYFTAPAAVTSAL